MGKHFIPPEIYLPIAELAIEMLDPVEFVYITMHKHVQKKTYITFHIPWYVP